jgi:hypothetical protein
MTGLFGLTANREPLSTNPARTEEQQFEILEWDHHSSHNSNAQHSVYRASTNYAHLSRKSACD